MELFLYRISEYDEDNGKEFCGVVVAEDFKGAVETLDEYYELDEIRFLAQIGNGKVYEMPERGFEMMEKIREEYIW